MIDPMKSNGPDEFSIKWPKLDSLIISATAGVILGLILLARGNSLPMHSPNDLSRWATVYSLAERGTYQIDETPWPPTIDRVQLNGHSYSSKPPLLPTLLAGEYLVLKKLSFGKLNFHDTPEAVIRTIVATVNLIPLVIFLILYSRLLNRLAPDPWVHTYAMVTAALGTYLTGFSVTLNNHTIAAFSSFFALYAAFLIWCEGQRKWWLFGLAGFFAAFAAVNELPAVSFLAGLVAGLLWKVPRRTLWALPFALLPIAGHFWTNYRVTGSLEPAYANKAAYDFPGSYWKIDPATGRLVGSRIDPATGQLVIHVSDGIDNQFEPWYLYLFNMLLGHHGIFSLSPIFIFTVFGIALVVGQPGNPLKAYGLLTVLLTTVLLIFYTFFAGQRNYGGMTNGLRWSFWLIPSWLMFLPFGLGWKASQRWFRGMALMFLVVSAASAFYATRNPWTRPWLHQFLYYIGWVKY
ncbi:MAG: hypothetical protein DMG06_09695 [Acidobacteria bacterium]|nr:MAG: hypothetical protein DMG06_09695 [Acidobacteriota bacterium]